MARKSKTKPPDVLTVRPRQAETEGVGDAECDGVSSDSVGALADRRLVERCLAGDVTAWEELYRQCHGPLCAAIKSLIVPDRDPNLIDEIAACVWYALVKNDGEMLERFDPRRDLRLTSFLRGLARIEIMQYFRAEQRRRIREAAAGRLPRNVAPLSNCQVNALLNEFTATLTIGEQQFLEEYLLSPTQEEDTAECSIANVWQRRRRIRMKLLAFLHDG